MTVTIFHGDCRAVLPTLADCSVQCCVTSPPYYCLRDYGVAGQIGLEPTPDEYVAEMVAVFREVKRVLRDDGTLFLNIGDSYSASQTNNGGYSAKSTLAGFTNPNTKGRQANREGDTRKRTDGVKPKDLLGIPWLLAFALRADGWYLRSDIIWHKPNPMPESVRDRPTSAHEHVFLLTKSGRYFYDAGAISEEFAGEPYEGRTNGAITNGDRADRGRTIGMTTERRNARNVWTIATQPYSGAHFATMPPDLAERCIKAGTSEKGACPHCGAPWVRAGERIAAEVKAQASDYGHGARRNDGGRSQLVGAGFITTGWQKSCVCPTQQPVPCVVLDPFGGAGTTGLVADRLNRNATLIELNPAYRGLAAERITADAPLFAGVK